jgi:chemotaxis-related protein WspB
MLFLLFQVGLDRYALDARQIAEVLPMVAIKRIPLSPRGVAGVCNYRGVPVPVIDLSELAGGRPTRLRFGTRLVLVHYADETGTRHLLGLVAEKATETLRCAPGDFVPSGVTNEGASFLGPVAAHAGSLIQRIEVDELLSPSVRSVLFRRARAGS